MDEGYESVVRGPKVHLLQHAALRTLSVTMNKRWTLRHRGGSAVMTQRRQTKHPGNSESGHTLLEVVVSVLIMGLMVLTMMPAFAGYQTNNSVRAAAYQALSQFREAELMTETTGQPLYVLFEMSDAYQAAGWTGPGWEICQVNGCGAGSKVLFKTVLPPTVGLSGCYRETFEPQGFISDNCGSGTVDFLCISNSGSNPLLIRIEATTATDRLNAIKATTC